MTYLESSAYLDGSARIADAWPGPATVREPGPVAMREPRAGTGAGTAAVEARDYLRAVLAAGAWYALAAALYLLWALLLGTSIHPSCVDASGDPCQSPRDDALSRLVLNLPILTVVVAASVLAAIPVRRVARDWHPLTVGFTATGLGSGLAALLITTLGE